jgi:tripartite-type tricarboxylate transporter receptor subunit TctC
MNRRQFTLIPANIAALICGVPQLAKAQNIEILKIVSGFPPGGTIDALARRIADKLRGNYSNAVVVENKPGAGGQLGVVAVKNAVPDGSTMLITPSSMLSIYPYTYPRLPYKFSDLVPISSGCYVNHGIAVGPAVPASVTTLKQFLVWAKSKPDAANYGSPGAGSMPHLIAMLLGRFSETTLLHIPYRGTVPGVQDLLAGQISSFCGPIGDYLPHVKTGRLRVLAISGKGRSTFLPDVSTMRELGYPITVREWYGLFLPAGATPEVVRRASAYLQPVLSNPELVEFGKQFGLEVEPSSADQLKALLASDAAEWKQLIRQTGFTAES